MQRMDFFFLSYLPKPRSGCSADTFFWNAKPFVRLSPQGQVAHILSVEAL